MSVKIHHCPGNPSFNDAALTVLSEQAFDGASNEITRWEGYSPTPLYALTELATDLGLRDIHYKHEGPRFGLGSFKALGGAYAAQHVLAREISRLTGTNISLADVRSGVASKQAARITLASATDGNHGRSLAWGCQRYGAQCRIYIHAEVSVGREQAMQDLGANVVRIDGDYDASVARCRDESAENGWFVVSDTSWPGYTETPRDVMSGYGVMFREVAQQTAAIPSHVFVQGGVGGLAAAAAASCRQLWGSAAPRLIVVEPDRAPCLYESARNEQLTNVAIEQETIMAGLSCGEPSPLAWEILRNEASDFLIINDSSIPPTMRRLAQPTGNDPAIDAGESGVAGLAALIAVCGSEELRETLSLSAESDPLVLGTEGVTDPAIFAEIMRNGV